MTTPAIEARQLSKTYRTAGRGHVNALRELNLRVEAGEVFGFIGPNGAGKTTAIKILAGLSWPTAGEAYIFGAPAGSVAARQQLGYLPETAAYHSFMAVEELLGIHAALAGVPSAERARYCREALEAVRLADRARSRISELSKGMQQRFGIAQAMVSRPNLLILDEVTSGLDPLSQKEVKDIIVHLKGRGITIFFSSHKLTEVEHICDQIGIIHQGRLLRASGLDEFLEASQQVDIRLRTLPEAAQAVLASKQLQARDEDALKLLTVPREDSDALLGKLLAAGADVHSFGPHRETLENAFFELVSQKPSTGDTSETTTTNPTAAGVS
jgi:ABC-2 type transport system ATP-binding protein